MYSILVKIDGFESRKRNAGLLHVVLGFFLVLKAFTFYASSEGVMLIILPYLIVAAISLYYGFFRKRTDPTGKNNFRIRLLQVITFLVFGIAMIRLDRPVEYYGMFIWAALTFILMVTERKIFRDTYIILDDKGIKVPGYYQDHQIEWNLLENVVVRHDFVTFFHRNNKYIQFQVMQTLSELEVAKMNAYCKEQIELQEAAKDDVRQGSGI